MGLSSDPKVVIRTDLDKGVLPAIWQRAGERIELSEFLECFTRFAKSAFRLETLPVYAVAHEDQHYAAYAKGATTPPFKFDSWKETIRTATAAGKSFDVVRVIPEPLTSYFCYEVDWCYREFVSDGQNTSFVTQASISTAGEGPRGVDFWLFDDKFAVVIDYDATGDVVAFYKIEAEMQLNRLRKLRDLANANSVPLDKFLVDYRPLARG